MKSNIILGIVFFALGGIFGWWAFGVGIGIGLWIGRLIFWSLISIALYFVLYFAFRKKNS